MNPKRTHLLKLMRYLVTKEPQVHYAQVRPMRTIGLSEAQMRTRLNRGDSITMDCSEAVTCLCKWAGLRDPNGRKYNGTGYTGTLLQYLNHYIQPRYAGIGALVVYGRGTGNHVAMVLEPGNDPLLWSHGQERGPILVRHSVESEWQSGPVTFLSIAKLL